MFIENVTFLGVLGYAQETDRLSWGIIESVFLTERKNR